jgi:hypothetical protein
MEKLASIASIVIDVGEACQTHGLVEEDLPDGLRALLKSLHRYSRHILLAPHCLISDKSDLDGIEGTLKLCTETSTIKRVLLRADILQKVRKYDAKLSNVLQTFHVRPDPSSLHLATLILFLFSRPSSLSMSASPKLSTSVR